MTTVADEIRAALKDVRGDGLTPEEVYVKCNSATSADQISIALSAFVKRDEAIRTTVHGQRAGRFRLNPQYVPARGQEEPGNGARLVMGSAHDDKQTPGPKPGKKNKKKRGKAAKKKAGKKRKYTRRVAPHPLPTLSHQGRGKRFKNSLSPGGRETERGASAAGQRASDFAINEDGDLGISAGEHKIALSRPEVQRLQGFLNTTAPLWQ